MIFYWGNACHGITGHVSSNKTKRSSNCKNPASEGCKNELPVDHPCPRVSKGQIDSGSHAWILPLWGNFCKLADPESLQRFSLFCLHKHEQQQTEHFDCNPKRAPLTLPDIVTVNWGACLTAYILIYSFLTSPTLASSFLTEKTIPESPGNLDSQITVIREWFYPGNISMFPVTFRQSSPELQ